MTGRDERVFRFDPLDVSGVFLGLGVLQLGLLGAGLAAGTAALTAGLSPLAAAACGLAGFGAAFGRVGGARLVDWAPTAARWANVMVRRQRRWFAPLALTDPHRPATDVALPACLHGLTLVEAPTSWTSTTPPGLIADSHAGTLSAVVDVAGHEFALLARDEQVQLLAGWGDVLAGFASERGAVARLAWSDHAAPSGLGSHVAWLDARPEPASGPAAEARAVYRDLLATTASAAIGHTTTVTVTVAAARLRRRQHTTTDDRLLSVLRTATETLCRGLRHAGLTVSDPLDVNAIAAIVRDRSTLPRPAARTGSLAHRLRALWGPLAVESAWGRVRTDGVVHRAYWVSDWPRLPQHPDWLGPFLAHDPGCPRTFTVLFEPVPPSVSRRRIDRDSIRLDTDATARAERGRRIDAHHRRAQRAVTEREAELVAGYAEVAYAGLVCLTAADTDRLDAACDDLEATGREHGLDLRALDGRHDLGWAAALPLGLGLGRTLP